MRSLVSRLFWILLVFTAISQATSSSAQEDTTAAAEKFLDYYESTVVPVDISLNRAWWVANTRGEDEDFAAKESLDKRMNEMLSDPAKFSELEAIKEGSIRKPFGGEADRAALLEVLGQAR